METTGLIKAPPVPFKAKALYQFFAENEVEMSLEVGDLVTVVAIEDEGWWEGTKAGGTKGLFPANYVEIIKSGGPPPKTSVAPIGKKPLINTGAAPPANNKIAINVNMNPEGQSPNVSPRPIARKQDAPATLNYGKAAIMAAYSTKPNNYKAGNMGLGEAKENTGTVYKYQGPGMAGDAVRTGQALTKFGQWSYNMAMITALVDVILGIFAVIWRLKDPNNHSEMVAIVGGYTILIGLLTWFCEATWGKSRSLSRIPSRAMLHMGAAIFQFFAIPTILSGVFQFTTGVVNWIACYNGETYEAPPVSKHTEKQAVLEATDSLYEGIIQWLNLIKQQNRLGVLAFVGVYLVGNVVLFIVTVAEWTKNNNATLDCQAGTNNEIELIQAGVPIRECKRLSDWGPWAKGFGAILDLNCSMIVMPVCRTLLRVLYNRSTRDQGVISKMMRAVLYFIPIDMNIAFHKLVAKLIVLGTFGHVGIHFINLSLKYNSSLNRFGVESVVTGAVVCYAMFFIYSAVPDNVKRGQFEIFWYCHHMFIVFFIVTLFHGHGGINPNYWKYFAAPGTLYLCERILRFYRSRQPVVVLSVTLMDDVFSLEFAKEGLFAQPYGVGQYLFIQCPHISRIEWHPFTISSAPDEKTVTIHVRVCGPNSWTRRVQNYISAMGPAKRSFFALDRQGKVPGKITGIDGRPLFCLDAPHSAPTQHLGEYKVAIIVGAGIGATPVSSALKSIVFHQWRLFSGQCFPESAYFMWVCAHRDIDAFRWLIRTIKESQDEIIHMRSTNPQNMANKVFQFHIWVTSKPKDAKPINLVIDDEIGFWGVPSEDSNLAKNRAAWDEADLYKVMKCPDRKTVLGDVVVWEGRPDWAPRFDEVNQKHPKGNIGVTFCGNPMIAHDLRRMCHRTNRIRQPKNYKPQKDDGLFKLHKENF